MSGSVAAAPMPEAVSPVVVTGQVEAPVVQDAEFKTQPAVVMEAAQPTPQVVMPVTTTTYPITYAAAPTYTHMQASPVTYTVQAPVTYSYPVVQQREQALTTEAPPVEATRETVVNAAPVYYTVQQPAETPVYYTVQQQPAESPVYYTVQQPAASPVYYTVAQPQTVATESVEVQDTATVKQFDENAPVRQVQEAAIVNQASVSHTMASPYYTHAPQTSTYVPQYSYTYAPQTSLQNVPSMVLPAQQVVQPAADVAPQAEVSDVKTSKKSTRSRGVAKVGNKSRCCL